MHARPTGGGRWGQIKRRQSASSDRRSQSPTREKDGARRGRRLAGAAQLRSLSGRRGRAVRADPQAQLNPMADLGAQVRESAASRPLCRDQPQVGLARRQVRIPASRTTTRPSLSGPTTFAWRAKRRGPRNRSACGFGSRIGPLGGCRTRRMSTTARCEPASPSARIAREPFPEARGSQSVLHCWRSQSSDRPRLIGVGAQPPE